jgi:hypothetical protein
MWSLRPASENGRPAILDVMGDRLTVADAAGMARAV